MNKVILTESQIKKLISTIISENNTDNMSSSIISNISQNIIKLKTTFQKQINNTSKIVDLNTLIDKMEEFLINITPNVLKTNIAPDEFFNTYYNQLFTTFDELTDNVGWVGKKLARAILGKQENAISIVDSWKFKDIIWALMSVGVVSSNPEWENQYNNIIQNNKQIIYQKIRDILIKKVYS